MAFIKSYSGLGSPIDLSRACDGLSEEWYVPSEAELSMVMKMSTSLGSDYSFVVGQNQFYLTSVPVATLNNNASNYVAVVLLYEDLKTTHTAYGLTDTQRFVRCHKSRDPCYI